MNKAHMQATIDQFWTDVKKLLKSKHHHSDQAAQQGIDAYRRATEPKAGEVIYNQGEEQTAAIIHGRIQGVRAAKKRVI